MMRMHSKSNTVFYRLMKQSSTRQVLHQQDECSLLLLREIIEK